MVYSFFSHSPSQSEVNSRVSSPEFTLSTRSSATSLVTLPHQDAEDRSKQSSTLYLGDLEDFMDEGYVVECIKWMGWDVSPAGYMRSNDVLCVHHVDVAVKVIRGQGISPGCAFLTYPTAQLAHAVLAFFESTGQSSAVMPGSDRLYKLGWATGRPGQAPTYEDEWSIFVGDLDRFVTERELLEAFRPRFASARTVKIMPGSARCRYGFVRFGSEVDMVRALAMGRDSKAGIFIRNRRLRIGYAASGGARARALSSALKHPSAWSSFPPTLRSEIADPSPATLHLYRQRYAALQRQRPSHSVREKRSPLADWHEKPIDGCTAPYQNLDDLENTTVFVGNLSPLMTEKMLESLFCDFGRIRYVKIPQGHGKRAYGCCAFIQFYHRECAELAIATMHNVSVDGKTRLRLSWGRNNVDKHDEHVRQFAKVQQVPHPSEVSGASLHSNDHVYPAMRPLPPSMPITPIDEEPLISFDEPKMPAPGQLGPARPLPPPPSALDASNWNGYSLSRIGVFADTGPTFRATQAFEHRLRPLQAVPIELTRCLWADPSPTLGSFAARGEDPAAFVGRLVDDA